MLLARLSFLGNLCPKPNKGRKQGEWARKGLRIFRSRLLASDSPLFKPALALSLSIIHNPAVQKLNYTIAIRGVLF